MIFYVSGNYSDEPAIIDYLVAEQHAVLTTFAYEKMLHARLKALAERARAAHWVVPQMVDSGAFTAWARGKAVNIASYIKTCNELLAAYSDCMDFTFVALDCIPGKKGHATTEEDRLTACKISADNYEAMKKEVKGKIKPVFHTGDPDWLLDCYADSDYVGFGMSQNLPEEQRISWVVQNRDKVGGRLLHGLAATGHRMLRAARWHSVDSAAWQYAASMGAINWIRSDGRLLAIAISNESPKQKDLDDHFKTLSEPVQRLIRQEMELVGTTEEDLAGSYSARWKWNIRMYKRACDMAAEAPILQQERGLFDA